MGWWSTIPIPRDNKYCHFCAYNVVENKAHFLLECPLLEISFLLFENVVLGSLKSFFQLDNQVDVGHYVTKLTTLRFLKKLACLAPSWCTFLIPLAFWASQTLKNNFISLVHYDI